MNTLLVFAALFAGACMADVSHIVDHKPHIAILESTQDASPDGNYHYGYKTENGISVQAEGNSAGGARGSYEYISPNGEPVVVSWTADESGFHAAGPSIPETPDHVLRTLEFNAAHPYVEPASP